MNLKTKKMKLITNIKYFILTTMVILFVSCEKEQSNSLPNNNIDNIKLIKFDNGMKSDVTILQFSTWDHYFNTIAQLEINVDQYVNQFSSQYLSLTDDQYNNLIDSLGFNEQYPLNQFESNLNFKKSLRSVFMNLESIWLDNDSLVFANAPQNKYPFTLEEMTLLNEFGEVMIGIGILKVMKDGFIFITDGDLETLNKFNNNDKTVVNQNNVISNLKTGVDEADCKLWKFETNYFTYASEQKKVNYHSHFHSYPSHCVSNVELTSYYKNNSGNWRRYSLNMTLENKTFFFDSDCKHISTILEPNRSRRTSNLNNRCWTLNPTVLEKHAKNNASVSGNYYFGTNPPIWDVLSW